MVDADYLPFLTTVSTFVVVTMATIFFCCFRRKSSSVSDGEDATKDKKVKNEEQRAASVKTGGNDGDVTAEQGPATDDTKQKAADNGSVSEKSSGFVDTNDDLGDFSAVQRETEILRSYRKPPPPKNRARQSRAPRGLTRSTENLDIFTELTEEDSMYDDTENKENEGDGNEAVKDVLDSAVLRPKSEGKENKRDTRSSMLADIEQTLAALHQSQTAAEPSSSSKSTKEPSPEKEVAGSEIPEIKNEIIEKSSIEPTKEAAPVISLQTSASESRVNPDFPKTSPVPLPKPGPKVSPKPKRIVLAQSQPKVDAETNPSDTKHAISNAEADEQSKAPESDQSKEDNTSSANTAEPSNSVPTSEAEDSQANAILTSTSQNIVNSASSSPPTDDSAGDKHITVQNLGNINGDSAINGIESIATSEKEENGSNADHSSEFTEETKDSVNLETKDTLPEGETKQSDGTENRTGADKVEDSSTAASTDDNTRDSSPVTAENREDVERASRQEEQQEPHNRVRRESSESKGKVSRIPVRAGSKSNASPPKTIETSKS